MRYLLPVTLTTNKKITLENGVEITIKNPWKINETSTIEVNENSVNTTTIDDVIGAIYSDETIQHFYQIADTILEVYNQKLSNSKAKVLLMDNIPKLENQRLTPKFTKLIQQTYELLKSNKISSRDEIVKILKLDHTKSKIPGKRGRPPKNK